MKYALTHSNLHVDYEVLTARSFVTSGSFATRPTLLSFKVYVADPQNAYVKSTSKWTYFDAYGI